MGIRSGLLDHEQPASLAHSDPPALGCGFPPALAYAFYGRQAFAAGLGAVLDAVRPGFILCHSPNHDSPPAQAHRSRKSSTTARSGAAVAQNASFLDIALAR